MLATIDTRDHTVLMSYDDAADRLVTEARNLGFEVVRIDPARQIHSAEDITLVNPTGSTIGFMLEDVTTGRHHFVPIDGLPSPSPGPGTGDGPELPPAPSVFFLAFCPRTTTSRSGARSLTAPGTVASIRRWTTR